VAVFLEPSGVYKSSGWASTGSNSIAVEMAQGVRYPASPALKGGKHTSNPITGPGETEAGGNMLVLTYPLLSSARGTPEKVSIWLYTNAQAYGAYVEWYPIATETSVSFAEKKATGEWGAPGVAEPYVITSAEQLAALVKAKELQVEIKAEDRALGIIAAACYWEVLYPGEFVPEKRVGRPHTASVLLRPPRNAARIPTAPREAQRIRAARTQAGGTLWATPTKTEVLGTAWSGSLASLQEGSATQPPAEPPAGKGYKLTESEPHSRLYVTLPLRPLAPPVGLQGVVETAELWFWSQGPILWYWEASVGSNVLRTGGNAYAPEAGAWISTVLPEGFGRERLAETTVALVIERASRVGLEVRAAALRISYTYARPLNGPSAALVPAVRHWAAVKQAPTSAIVRRAATRAVVGAPRTGVVLQPEHFSKS
jgi:hypothetical protein